MTGESEEAGGGVRWLVRGNERVGRGCSVKGKDSDDGGD